MSLFVLTQQCSNVRLNRVEKPVKLSSKGTFCTQPPSRLDFKTKFLFVVDKSGSNNQTDPGATRRADGIEQFWIDNRNEPGTEWSVITFNDGQATPLIVDDVGLPVFSDVQADMQTAVDMLRAGDNGDTPYGNAIQMSETAITNDIDTHPNEDRVFMVFFISDGGPTDFTGSDQHVITPAELQTFTNAVERMVDIEQGSIFFSTAYYDPTNRNANPPDTVPEVLLQEMAKSGNGRFVNFVDNQNWDFKDLVIKPTTDSWLIKNLLVYNMNAGYCLDGQVGPDSDMDGMCDRDEIELAAFGFDPQNRFSFGDGYGDYFHWRVVEFGEQLPSCDFRDDIDFDMLTECEELYVRNQSPPEGIPKRAEAENFDTDGDGFLDGIETFVFFTRSIAYALDPFNMSKNIFDGESDDAGTQIAQHRNPLIPDVGADRYDTRYALVDVNSLGQSCYSFSQNDLALYQTKAVAPGDTYAGLDHLENENVVYVHYIQTPQSDPNGTGILMHSHQRLKYDRENPNAGGGLIVNDAVFRDYRPVKN